MLRLLFCCWLLPALCRVGIAGPVVAAGMMAGDGQSLPAAEGNQPLPRRSLFSCPEPIRVAKNCRNRGLCGTRKGMAEKAGDSRPDPTGVRHRLQRARPLVLGLRLHLSSSGRGSRRMAPCRCLAIIT